MSDLIERLRAEADAMHAAPSGKCVGDSFHALNWSDKPHRVLYDAVKLLREAADRIAALEAEASEGERLRAALLALRGFMPPAGDDRVDEALRLADAALIPEAPATEGWQPISSAPKDGTVVDLWHEEFGRQADFKWGHTEHSCGEAGCYCDSDWHSEEAGWVETALNERYFAEDVFTHWRPLPPPPQDREPDSQRGAK